MVTDARHTLDDQVEGSAGADCKELYSRGAEWSDET